MKKSYLIYKNSILAFDALMWVLACMVVILYIFFRVNSSLAQSGNGIIYENTGKSISYEKKADADTDGFLFFTVKKKEEKIQLSWAVEGRLNNDLYEIEHSFNGLEFELIGSIERIQRRIVSEYSFIDKKADLEQIHFYRLKEIDSSGHITYSCVRGIYPESFENQSMRLYPTPVADSLNISFFCQADESINVIVSGAENDFIKTYSYALQKGPQVLKLCMEGIPSGNYVIKVSGGETLYVSSLEVAGKNEIPSR